MVYLNVKYVIATRSYELYIYIYAESHWKYHTFEGYYICSFSKLRHMAKVSRRQVQGGALAPPWILLFSFLQNTIHAQSLIQSEIRQQISVFHK